MRDFPITVSIKAGPKRIERAVDAVGREFGLVQAMKDTLSKYPGCVHWHFKRSRVSGTVEVTWWPAERKLWISIQQGRRAEWIDSLLPEFKRALERSVS